MGISRENFGVIAVPVTYRLSHKETGAYLLDAEGKPQMATAVFYFRRRTDARATQEQRDKVLSNGHATLPDVCLERFVELISKPPIGVDDWPTEGTIEEQAQTYFSADDYLMWPLGAHALALYWGEVHPREFFRSV